MDMAAIAVLAVPPSHAFTGTADTATVSDDILRLTKRIYGCACHGRPDLQTDSQVNEASGDKFLRITQAKLLCKMSVSRGPLSYLVAVPFVPGTKLSDVSEEAMLRRLHSVLGKPNVDADAPGGSAATASTQLATAATNGKEAQASEDAAESEGQARSGSSKKAGKGSKSSAKRRNRVRTSELD